MKYITTLEPCGIGDTIDLETCSRACKGDEIWYMGSPWIVVKQVLSGDES